MQQVSFGAIPQEYLQNCLEDLLLDHLVDAHCVLRLDDCLEEFYDLNVGLDRVESGTGRHFYQYFVLHEEGSQLVLIDAVSDKLVDELKD